MLEGSCLCGSVRWRFDGVPEAATICNCTSCRRYGALWAYDYVGGLIHVSGETKAYVREPGSLGTHFCPQCGCVALWRGTGPEEDGRVRIAVNLRLAEPEQGAAGEPGQAGRHSAAFPFFARRTSALLTISPDQESCALQDRAHSPRVAAWVFG